MRDRDLLEIFDAALPRLDTYKPKAVPVAGFKEYREHQELAQNRRTEMGLLAAVTALTGVMTWFAWMPWVPVWILAPMLAITIASGAGSARRFLQLAFGQRLEQALPSGTDVKTALLEDGASSLIRSWSADAFVWNQRVAALRLEVADWQRLTDVPEARDIDWTEYGSVVRAEGLIAEIQGFAADRSALVARKEEIDHRLLRLDARLLQLTSSEEVPTLALPAPTDDPSEE